MQTIDQQQVKPGSSLELIAREVVEGFITGLHKSPFHGFSVEFAEHRLYNTGESTKHIDWKLYGRTEKMFTKRYEEETNLRCQLVVDNSSSMHYPEFDAKSSKHNKISFSVYCAASIIHLLRKQRDAVGLSVFSDKVDVHTKAKSSSVHHKLLYYELEKAMNSGGAEVRKTSAAEALHQIAESVHKRSMIILFSDMLEDSGNESSELFSALQHLKYNKHEVVLFHVVDKDKEIDFNFDNRPYLFEDVETGEKLKIHSNKVRESYLKAVGDFTKELKLRCAQYRIDFVEADIHKGYKQVLLPYLIKRQKMA